MIRQDIKLEHAPWDVVVIYGVDGRGEREVKQLLKSINCPRRELMKAARMIRGNRMNEGMTYTNLNECVTVMIVGPTTSTEEFYNTYQHELGHVTRHISEALNISPYGEREQYIRGELSEKTFHAARRFLCDHCRDSLKQLIKIFPI